MRRTRFGRGGNLVRRKLAVSSHLLVTSPSWPTYHDRHTNVMPHTYVGMHLRGYTDTEAHVVYEKPPSFEDKVLVHVPDHSDMRSLWLSMSCFNHHWHSFAIKPAIFTLHIDFSFYSWTLVMWIPFTWTRF